MCTYQCNSLNKTQWLNASRWQMFYNVIKARGKKIRYRLQNTVLLLNQTVSRTPYKILNHGHIVQKYRHCHLDTERLHEKEWFHRYIMLCSCIFVNPLMVINNVYHRSNCDFYRGQIQGQSKSSSHLHIIILSNFMTD